MPDMVTHIYFGEQVLSSLPETISQHIEPKLFSHTALGPDIWFFIGFYGANVRSLSPRGVYMHENRTGEFLTALAKRTGRAADREGMFSYLTGYLCHYALDCTAHPYIIYRTGNYKETPETLRYRGNHTRLERAIDCWVIREKYGCRVRDFSLTDRSLPLKRLPESIREDLDAVYREVFGWDSVWASLNRSIQDQRMFYRLVQDPSGLLDRIANLADNGTSKTPVNVYSYHGRELDRQVVDFLNEKHTPWCNFADASLQSTESFPDLLDRAGELARQYLRAAYRYVYEGSVSSAELSALIGNRSYTSGLDCRDMSNRAPFVFDPLF